MTEFRIRPRRVRMKSGGADVRVLHTPMPNEIDGESENWAGKMIENAKAIAGFATSGDALDGYVIIGLWESGKRSLSYRMSSKFPREMMPSYIAEMIRSDMVTAHEAGLEFDARFEWLD